MISVIFIWPSEIICWCDDYWIKHDQLNTRDGHCVLAARLCGNLNKKLEAPDVRVEHPIHLSPVDAGMEGV